MRTIVRYISLVFTFVVVVLSSGCRNLATPRPPQQASTVSAASPERALLDQYCVTCHNQRSKTANVMFDSMDLANLSKDAKIWERAVRKLRGGMMPPPGARQPDRGTIDAFTTWLEKSLDHAGSLDPN